MDEFKLVSKPLGSLKKIVLGHIWKEGEGPGRSREELSQSWICELVLVKDTSTGIEYVFPVNDAIIIDKKPKLFNCEDKRETLASKTKSLKNIDYQVTLVTGNEKGAGTSESNFNSYYFSCQLINLI